MSHTDLRREAALLCETAVWHLVWVCGLLGVCFMVG